VAQPRNSGVRGFRYRSDYIKEEDRLGRTTGAFLRETPPLTFATTGRCIAADPSADRVDTGVVFVSWPMSLKVVKERDPVALETMRLEIAQRK
jgi:hypothetical protein